MVATSAGTPTLYTLHVLYTRLIKQQLQPTKCLSRYSGGNAITANNAQHDKDMGGVSTVRGQITTNAIFYI